MYLAYHVVYAEALNIPQVMVVNKGFYHDAKSAVSSQGMPGVRVVPENVPSECKDRERIENDISAVIDDIVAALTKPLTAEEKSPTKEIEKTSGTIFKGDLDEVNQFFYKRGWTDGLPIIPPTEAKVEEMLTGTDLPRDHVVGKLVARLGKATVEKIAINAVMAGALPTYMPLLIAGVQALIDPRAQLKWHGGSTGSFVPTWIINGPIRHDLHVNSGPGVLSPGEIANAAIGRTMGLIIKNIGGYRKNMEDMGIFGNPGKYTAVIAENEEESPWEPLHVEFGFKKEDSALTLFFWKDIVNCYSGDNSKDTIKNMLYSIQGGGNMWGLFLVVPETAQILAGDGLTKKDIADTIFEYGRLPAYRLHGFRSYLEGKPFNPDPDGVRKPRPIDLMDPVRVFPDPGCIRSIVCGGPHGSVSLLTAHIKRTLGQDWVTQKVELPANWDKLVAKYKNLVPTYAMY